MNKLKALKNKLQKTNSKDGGQSQSNGHSESEPTSPKGSSPPASPPKGNEELDNDIVGILYTMHIPYHYWEKSLKSTAI